MMTEVVKVVAMTGLFRTSCVKGCSVLCCVVLYDSA